MAANAKSAEGRSAVLVLPILALGVSCAAVLLAVAAGLGSRFGWWNFRTGFTLLGYGAYGGLAAVLLGVTGAIMAGRRRASGLVLALLAMAVGCAVAAVPLSWRLHARQLPVIHDITTDTVNPPQFVAILPLRRDAANPAIYGGYRVAEEQKKGYPDLHTEVLDLAADRAFERALAAAKAEGWHIVAAEPATGRIEATDTTFWFGFIDDIVIRLVPAGDRTLMDIRSVSRVGKSDAGTNAQRIRSYLKQLRSSR